MDQETLQLIVSLRHCGNRHSWEEIGQYLNITAEAARCRYRRRSPETGAEPCPLCGSYEPVIRGVTAFDLASSPEEAWQKAITLQKDKDQLRELEKEQQVCIPGEDAFGWAWISDTHFGGDTDYKQIRRDAEIIRDTPRMWAAFNGDATNNWIWSKLMFLQRTQGITHDEEWALFLGWLDILGPKLKVVAMGNHDLWTMTLAGVDRMRDTAVQRDTAILYGHHEIAYDLVLGDAKWRVKQRHKWRGSSIFNPTHGIEVGWERGGNEFDIGVGSHTHLGTICRPFFKHGTTRYAVLIGTYDQGRYGKELGMAPTVGTGCGAMVFAPTGSLFFCDNLEVAAWFLTWLNEAKPWRANGNND